MNFTVPAGWNTLSWFLFDPDRRGNWTLRLLPHYAALFNIQEPEIVAQSSEGWVDSSTGKSKCCTFSNLSVEERRRIRDFIEDYERVGIVGPSSMILSSFSDELYSCIALGRTFEDRDGDEKSQRTPIYKAVYEYKYRNIRGGIESIVNHIAGVAHLLPGLHINQEQYLSYVPPKPNKRHDLPRALTDKLVDRLADNDSLSLSSIIIHPVLVIDKPAFKDLTLDEKIRAWQSIYDLNGVRLSDTVQNRSVIVIDDLYESGTTLWSYARFLKSQGARVVHGLVCVKTFSNTDNK